MDSSSANIIHPWGPQTQGDPPVFGDLQLDFPFDFGDLGLDLDIADLGSPQTAAFSAPAQPIIPSTFTPQQTVGPSNGYPHPSAFLPVINRRDLGLLFGNPNIPTGPIPMTSGVAPAMAPAPASLSPFIGANPATAIFGSPSGAPMQIVRPWDAPAGSSMGRATTAPAFSPNPGPSQAPIFHCACVRQHGHPLVRVHDTVEWVRPDVMRMVVYFNFSPNAAIEAHSSWERRDAERGRV